MNSKLTAPQRILSKFQVSSMIFSSDHTDSSDKLEDFYDERAEPRIKELLTQLTHEPLSFVDKKFLRGVYFTD